MRKRKQVLNKNRSKFRKRYFSLLALPFVIISIVLLTRANYFISNFHQQTQIIIQQPTPTPLVVASPTPLQPTPTPRPIPSLGQIPPTSQETLTTWKRYTNTKYGYTMMYPPDMTIWDFTDNTHGLIDETYSLIIDIPNDHGGIPLPMYIDVQPKVIPTGFTHSIYDGFITNQIQKLSQEKIGTLIYPSNYPPVVKTDDLIINNMQAYAIAMSNIYLERRVVIKHNNMYYIIGSFWKDDVFKQLLSTFTFTN